MSEIFLYNTLTRRKELFRPIDPAHVRMYVCGPTVYDFAHIGNARPVIVFDLLFRLLRHVYGPDHVTYARNITDVDDKINARAAEAFPGINLNDAIRRVTESTERQFRLDVSELGCLEPSKEPRATEHIEQMRDLIERLVDRGVAYVAEDHVLFSPSSMNKLPNMPRYGTLSRRSLDEMVAGARIDVAPYKRDPMDFVLWKPSKDGEPGWKSPCNIKSLGRPGWHIECSAMAWEHLIRAFDTRIRCDAADENVFDIHGGGIDLVFPHHENEIAQSCCAFGTSRMAQIWMHNGFLQVEGQKMSKSLGNFITINDLLRQDVFGKRSWSGAVLRLAMLKTHYRQPIDWTIKGLEDAEKVLQGWQAAARRHGELAVTPAAHVPVDVFEAVCDDLNTPLAITHMHSLAREANAGSVEAAEGLVSAAELLGFDTAGWLSERRVDDAMKAMIDMKIMARKEARAARNWAESDRIRDELLEMGIVLKDNKDGTTTWEMLH